MKSPPDNPYREEIIRHLFSAHYYGLGYYMHGLQSQSATMTAQQERCEKFMSLVAENFKRVEGMSPKAYRQSLKSE